MNLSNTNIVELDAPTEYRYAQPFPFVDEIDEHSITKPSLLVLPIVLHCVQLHPCYQMMMSNGRYATDRNGNVYTLRLDRCAINALYGTIPPADFAENLRLRRRDYASSKRPDERKSRNGDCAHDIFLTGDVMHPLKLLGSAAIDYFAKLQIIYSRSTMHVNDFDF